MTTPASSTVDRVTKRARDTDHGRRMLLAEADLLALAQMPGVVTLLGVEGDEQEPVLVTARVDGPDLVVTPGLAVEEVAGVVAALATTLADLHDLGVVHGAVAPEHVLLGPDGRPVLCGFGHGARCGEAPAAEAQLPDGAADPARAPGDPLTPAVDVHALGHLLASLVVQATGPSSGPRRPGRSGAGVRVIVDGLRAVAARATAADPALRPTARSLAAAAGAAVPGARLPRPVGHEGPASPPAPATSALHALRRRGAADRLSVAAPFRRRLVAAAGIAVVLGAAAVALRLALASGAAPSPALPAASVTRPGRSGVVPTSTARLLPTSTVAPVPSTPAAAHPSCPAAAGLLVADVDADGCPDSLRWAEGVIEAGSRRWTVGHPGDQVATADWSCSGTATLALLRPASGDVFVFDGWAGPDHDLTATAVGRVDGGFALRAADLGDGCPRLVVERSGGPPVTVGARARP